MKNIEKFKILERDYDRKNEQLHRHLSSLWVRFNFFITFQGILVGSRFLSLSGKSIDGFSYEIIILGLIVSVIWYLFAANDRYLVKLYRTHVDHAYQRMIAFLNSDKIHFDYLNNSEYVIQVSPTEKVKMNVFGWRLKKIGLTDYATMTPIVMTVFWVGILVYHIVSSLVPVMSIIGGTKLYAG